ncbi:MAG: amidohydrolase family protein [Chloroflexi bacterium]|nr:amidohydrolase family protein [Chloroflexota bacterium]
MLTLTQLSGRAPTVEENQALITCFAGEQASVSSMAAKVDTAAAAPTLLEQALESPGLMWCLAGNMGMESLLQLDGREPTARERMVVQMCLFDKQEIAMWDAEWPKRVDAAFTPAQCGSPPTTGYPASYYGGPLIDSHLHIPQLPDDAPGGIDDGYQAPRGSESDLYDAIAEEDRPLLGRTVNINRIACALKYEGTTKAFAFFPTFPEITSPAIDVAYRTVEEYPSLFVPFIQASANGVSTLEGTSLEVMLGVRPDFFFGFGEVGDSPTEPINPPPDSDIYTGDFEVARDHGLVVYYHTGVDHQENMARALARFPEVTFIVHGDFVRPHIVDLMDRYPNIYFTFNDIFEEIIPQFRFGAKQDFISLMSEDWDTLLDQAVALYRPMIEAHPDRFMWGTDRGDIVWHYDEDLGRLIADYGRAFIGRFDPEIREMIAYKNAELIIANHQR